MVFISVPTDLVSNLTVPEMVSQLGNGALSVERLDIPNYQWWSEALHGLANSPGVSFKGKVQWTGSNILWCVMCLTLSGLNTATIVLWCVRYFRTYSLLHVLNNVRNEHCYCISSINVHFCYINAFHSIQLTSATSFPQVINLGATFDM